MKSLILPIVILLAGCAAKERVQNVTDEFQAGAKLAELKSKALREISGMASSINNPKLLWVHNDAGNKPEVYLLDQKLDIKLTCLLEGVENRDWEDIAVGPGPDSTKTYVYVGDIGDNDGQYRHKYVYRFEEPAWNGSDATIIVRSIEKISFALDDRPKDSETLLVDPKSRNLYVVSKRENPVHIYELKYPYSTGEPGIAKELMSLPMTRIVGGDFSHDGREIIMKNYDRIFYWKSQKGMPIQEVLKAPAGRVQYEKEPQGEAITFAHDGGGFYTLSEATKGTKVYLYFFQRKQPD